MTIKYEGGITDEEIERLEIKPEEIPLKYGTYEGDYDVASTQYENCCQEVSSHYCTRSEMHKGLHVAHGLDDRIHARWK